MNDEALSAAQNFVDKADSNFIKLCIMDLIPAGSKGMRDDRDRPKLKEWIVSGTIERSVFWLGLKQLKEKAMGLDKKLRPKTSLALEKYRLELVEALKKNKEPTEEEPIENDKVN